MSKTINSLEVMNKLKNGDLFYSDNVDSGHVGWKMFVNGGNAGLSTQIKRSHKENDMEGEKIKTKKITKIIFLNDIDNGIRKGYFAEFLHTFDESIVKPYITTVIYKSEKEEKLEKLISDLSSQLNSAKTELEAIKRGE